MSIDPKHSIDPERARESNTEWILGVTGTLYVIAVIFASLRLYTRAFLAKTIGRDDYVLIASVVLATVGMVLLIMQGIRGMGKHQDTLSDDDVTEIMQLSFYLSNISGVAGRSLLKISIALSLLRFSRSRWYSRSLWALIVFVVLCGIFAWVTIALYCKPLAGYWDKSLEPECYDIKLFISFGLFYTCNILHVYRRLLCCPAYPRDLDTADEATNSNTFDWHSESGLLIAYGGEKDGTLYVSYACLKNSVQFWGFVQFCLAITAACAPSLKPLLGRALKISSTDKYKANLYENRYPTNRLNSTMRRRGYMEQTSQDSPEFELQDRALKGSDDTHHSTINGGPTRTASIMFGKPTSDRSTSEETILREANVKGIVCTTEITVRR
ncbi:integral membrane protein [Colletotrichum camelliae]|nr:integral membrane protein [Colletotrichum camelliae]